MTTKTIVFPAPGEAELRETELKPLRADQVRVRMEYSVISAGTERACLLGMENTVDHFPVYPGYSGIGRVTEVGEDGGDLSPRRPGARLSRQAYSVQHGAAAERDEGAGRGARQPRRVPRHHRVDGARRRAETRTGDRRVRARHGARTPRDLLGADSAV